MASHFDAVGFAAREVEDVKELLTLASERAQETVAHAHGRTLHCEDPAGATLAIHVDGDGAFECCQPGFAGRSRFRWRPLYVVPDPNGCRFCDLVYAELLDEDEDELVYPFALTIETMGATRALIPYGEAGEVRFVGLWEEGQVWPDEAAFELDQKAEWDDVALPEVPGHELPATFGGFASRSLIPSGIFALDDGGEMSSHVIAHGIVASVEERRTELGNALFRVVRLDTLGGVFDTCLAPGTLEQEELLAPGAVARATLWLVGRPLTLRGEPGPVPTAEPERRGLLGRLLGRRRRDY
ncbi:MAG TPA: hypothetical protein VE753_09910 [Gaiellaceae bacterium]|nr:hypothetical protein [Gaiellaceae bacterium]